MNINLLPSENLIFEVSPKAKTQSQHPERDVCAFPRFESDAPPHHEASSQEVFRCDEHCERIVTWCDLYEGCLSHVFCVSGEVEVSLHHASEVSLHYASLRVSAEPFDVSSQRIHP